MQATEAGRPSRSSISTPVRVAFLWPFGVRSATELSGMPWEMEHALRRAGLDVVPILGPRRRNVVPQSAVEVVCGRGVVRRNAKLLRQCLRKLRDESNPKMAMRRHVVAGRDGAHEISRAIRDCGADVIFGCCVSRTLGALSVDLPVVYFSDTTARLITTTYPAYRRRSEAYKRACDKLEQLALDRADLTCFATNLARRSAIETYGVQPDRAFVAPMGASITPADLRPDAPGRRAAPPSKDDLRICVVASDPERKRTDDCVDVVKALRDRSWNASMTLIGAATTKARSASFVTCAGRLDHSRPEDRARHAEILAESHLLLQPSLAEAYGIAPCEAASFGVPSVVSDAGGLPEVVIHDRTGVVVPVDAGADAFADEAERIISDPERYRAMSEAARERASSALDWDRWGEAVAGLIHTCLESTPAAQVSIATAIKRRTLTAH